MISIMTDLCFTQSELIHGYDNLPAAKAVITTHGLSLVERLMRVNMVCLNTSYIKLHK